MSEEFIASPLPTSSEILPADSGYPFFLLVMNRHKQPDFVQYLDSMEELAVPLF